MNLVQAQFGAVVKQCLVDSSGVLHQVVERHVMLRQPDKDLGVAVVRGEVLLCDAFEKLVLSLRLIDESRSERNQQDKPQQRPQHHSFAHRQARERQSGSPRYSVPGAGPSRHVGDVGAHKASSVLRTAEFAEVHEVGLFVAHGAARRLIGRAP